MAAIEVLPNLFGFVIHTYFSEFLLINLLKSFIIFDLSIKYFSSSKPLNFSHISSLSIINPIFFFFFSCNDLYIFIMNLLTKEYLFFFF
ncbi:hypothetical protein U3516DRAFT_916517, partial [Neocallimastix sp. 'constans']